MSGNDFLLDTNAILYMLDGDAALAELLYNERLYLSIITEIRVVEL
jgi:predicted nucleic acid-binding protein